MGIFLFVLCVICLLFCGQKEKGCEEKLYRALVLIAALLSLTSAFAQKSEHIGASLSGMISIFMR
ncbi:MAG: hypothetical protein IKU65_03805 [Oscillospiraceae bacterium]|nr:hypothetical protein [Oscillospiraceae bacterium]